LRATAVSALLLAATLASAQAAERRVTVDPNEPPWDAVAKVQTNTGQRCSGVLIAPATALTAAHCLYNPRTGAMLQPLSLHVLFGYQRGAYRSHRLVRSFTVGPAFDRGKGPPQTSDWARLELAEPVPVAPLPVAGKPPPPGAAVALAGYNQDKAQLLMVGLDCHVLRVPLRLVGAAFITHDCAGTRGTSGGPLLARQGGGWAIVGIAIAAGGAENLALALPFAD
jgi:protease YdgD